VEIVQTANSISHLDACLCARVPSCLRMGDGAGAVCGSPSALSNRPLHEIFRPDTNGAMQRTRFSRTMPRVFPSLLAFAFLTYLAINHRLHGQTAVAEHIVVTAEEAGSAYGAPPSFSRSRFSPTPTAYVLPPWSVYPSAIYQGDALRFNRPDHQFTQEVELGLPYRFGVAIENTVEAFRGTTQERTFSIEARYAFADWNKIPLNPTIFAEWKFGIVHILHDEGPPEPLPKGV